MKESRRDLLTVAYWAISLVEKTAVWTVATMIFSLAVSSAADVVDEMVVNQVSWMELYMVYGCLEGEHIGPSIGCVVGW